MVRGTNTTVSRDTYYVESESLLSLTPDVGEGKVYREKWWVPWVTDERHQPAGLSPICASRATGGVQTCGASVSCTRQYHCWGLKG